MRFLSPDPLRKFFRFACAGLLGCAFALFATPVIAALHPGDKVDILVYNHPELSTSVIVDSDGFISLPVAGSIEARGRTTRQLARQIEQNLHPYVRDVAVSVQLNGESENIFVSGGPGGALRFHPGETLTSAVDELQPAPQAPVQQTPALNQYEADPTQDAVVPKNRPLDLDSGPVDFHTVRILRDGSVMGPFDLVALRDNGAPGPELRPDDTIELTDKPIKVRVIGEVQQPGATFVGTSDSLSRAIDQAGGLLPTSSVVDIRLERGSTSQVIPIGDPLFSQPAQDGDVVYVSRAPTVDVLGIVLKPGATLLRGNQTLVSAIYYAGGPSKYANLRAVSVTHDGVKTQYDLYKLNKGASGQNPRLSDGDVVFVPEGSTFDVMTLFQAISALGWVGTAVR